MKDPVKRLEEKYDRLVTEGRMTARRSELMERRMRQLTDKPTHYDRKIWRKDKVLGVVFRNKYRPRPTIVKNPLVRENMNAQYRAWYLKRFGELPAAS